MYHERFAPLLSRIVLTGLVLGLVVLVQVLIERGPAPSPLLRTAVGIIPAGFVAIFFLRVMLFDLSDRHAVTVWMGGAVSVVVALQLTLLIAPWASGTTGATIGLTLRLIKFAYTLLVAMVLAVYASHRLNQIYGHVAALVFLTTPPFLAPAHIGLLSLDLVFYGTSALLCLFLWGETAKVLWLVIGGLCVGFVTCGVTWESGLFAVVLALFILLLLSRYTQRGESPLGLVVLFTLACVIPIGGWQAISYFSPSNVFPGLLLGHVVTTAPAVRDGFTSGTSFVGILQSIPRSILFVFPGQTAWPYPLTLGPAAVCFLPWALKGKWGYEKRILLAVAGVVFFLVWFAGELKTLGVLPIIPLLALLATFGIHNLYMNVRRPTMVFSAVTVLIGWNAVIVWKYIG